ncbi:MAG: flagellar basal body-associated FliL family protein [Kofleriaceae bacterium]
MVLLLVMNLGASGFTTFKVATAHPAQAATPHEKPPAPPANEVTGKVVPLDPFVVNLDEPGQSRYLKLTLQFELSEESAEAALNKSKQLIRDAFLSHLSGLKLVDTLGVPAKDKLRADLMAKLVEILGPNKVRRMFFQEFVVQ